MNKKPDFRTSLITSLANKCAPTQSSLLRPSVTTKMTRLRTILSSGRPSKIFHYLMALSRNNLSNRVRFISIIYVTFLVLVGSCLHRTRPSELTGGLELLNTGYSVLVDATLTKVDLDMILTIKQSGY